MAANYSAVLRSPCEGERLRRREGERAAGGGGGGEDVAGERANSPRHFTSYARVRPLRRDKTASSPPDVSPAPSPLPALSLALAAPGERVRRYGFFDWRELHSSGAPTRADRIVSDSINRIYRDARARARARVAPTRLCETCGEQLSI